MDCRFKENTTEQTYFRDILLPYSVYFELNATALKHIF